MNAPGLLCLLLCIPALAIDNGLGLKPPMSWRSWNAFFNEINQTLIMQQIDALVARDRMVDGVPTSLLDIGYDTVGIDEGWEACAANSMQHDAEGNPTINKTRFPDMGGLVKYAKDRGVKMGWYMNGCLCSQNVTSLIDYEGDVRALVTFGFDAVKFDNCGAQHNLTLWAQLINQTGHAMMIENCHWGQDTPTADWCPYNFFRVGGDTCRDFEGCIMPDITMMPPYLTDGGTTHQLSQPGCWAYPDMLEVGNLRLYVESRTNFGLWALLSSPLTLGFDMRPEAGIMDQIWDIITNKEVLAVNQGWAGSPGRHITQYPSMQSPRLTGVPCGGANTTQWHLTDGMLQIGDGWCADGIEINWIQMKPCNRSAPSQQFVYQATPQRLYHPLSTLCMNVWNQLGPQVVLYPCNDDANQRFSFASNGSLICATGACMANRQQEEMDEVYAKDLPHGQVAAIAVNAGDLTGTMTLTLASLNLTGSYKARDLWNHREMGVIHDKIVETVVSHDSIFVLLTPLKDEDVV